MLHASTRKLIDRLSEMTELGKLDWTETEDGTLAYATEGYSVTLTETPNEVIITSKTGKELERASAEELASTQQDDGGAYTSVVAAMTMEASRIARGTEAAISSLLADLQDAPEVDPAIEETDADDDLVEDPVNETTAIVTEPVAPIAPDPEPEAEIAAETVTETDISTADEPVSEDAPESPETEAETIAAPETESTEVDAVEEASDASSDAEPTAFSETDEPETESETESDVTEAVARLAKEVNQRDDTGLDAAAASAVGAVALAAGLATQSGPEDDDTPASEEHVDDAPAEIAATEPAAVPAYIPFGLGAETEPEIEAEDEPEIVAVATEVTTDDIETAEDHDAPAEITAASPFAFTPAAEPEPEQAPAETMWQSPETSAEPEAKTEIEPVAEMVADAEPETPFQIATEPVEGTGSNFTIAAPAFSAVTDTVMGEREQVADAAEDASEEMAAIAETEETVETEAAEPPAPETEAEPEPEAAAPEPPKTYSLSGIGAGFGLGALSAKTEASGIPSARPSNAPAPEKVIIDATDDVLPELEGNLNVALAETASAAVSAANGDSVAVAEGSEPEKDPETDILKPRTRFNPWD